MTETKRAPRFAEHGNSLGALVFHFNFESCHFERPLREISDAYQDFSLRSK